MYNAYNQVFSECASSEFLEARLDQAVRQPDDEGWRN